MAVTTSTGLTSVTGNVSSVPEEVSVTLVSGTRAAAGTTTIATVGANKKWYILGVNMSAVYGAGGTIKLQLNGNDIMVLDGSMNTAIQNLANAQSWNYKQCPTLAATQTITLVLSANSTEGYACIQYVEVSV